MGKTRKVRKAPIESATSLPEGTIKSGWVIKKAANGVPRWMPNTSVELNGFKLFSVDHAKKYIGKPITLYSREFKDMWPKQNAWSKPTDSTHMKYKFVPSGDARKGTRKLPGWLRSRKPGVQKGNRFYIDGPVYLCEKAKCDDFLADGLQLDSSNGKTISDDLMSSEMFVKI